MTFQEKIESSTDVLTSILKPIIQQDKEIVWPPQDLNLISDMKKVIIAFFSMDKFVVVIWDTKDLLNKNPSR